MKHQRAATTTLVVLAVMVFGIGADSCSEMAEEQDSDDDFVVDLDDEPRVEDEPDPLAGYSMSQRNAIESAASYLDYSGFSRSGLIDQLKYEKYSTADATTAVDALNVNWNAEAVESAQSYLDYSSFSCQGLIDQLVFEGFTSGQARHGATQAGLC